MIKQLLSSGHCFFFYSCNQFCSCVVVVNDFLVMVVNDAAHVQQAAVA